MAPKRRHHPSSFSRDADGSVRLRIRFDSEAASLIEEAAGDTPLMVWLFRTLEEAARRQVQAARQSRPPIEPPE